MEKPSTGKRTAPKETGELTVLPSLLYWWRGHHLIPLWPFQALSFGHSDFALDLM